MQVFLHRLALALHRTVGELESGMTHRELTEWLRFEATVSPLPDRLADMHCALICSLIVNRTRSADSEPAAVADFYVIRDQPPTAPPADGDGRTEAERAAAIWRGGS